ncbi:MAG: diguanylate cyclase [Dehalococcoidia bacterium]|nr:diguanylate cyclase [Dehalococcoidia bacterium]
MKYRELIFLVVVPLAAVALLLVDVLVWSPSWYGDTERNLRNFLVPSVITLFGVLAYLVLERREDKRRERELQETNQRLLESEARLQELAITDPLTGVFNRRQFYDNLQAEFRRARRYSRPLSLLLVDIDHFKQINDEYGHIKGDQVLAAVAVILSNEIRGIDVLARFGGEEFVVMLPETSAEAADVVGEKLRRTIESSELPDGIETGLNISVGVASLTETMESEEELVQAADAAMYEAKQKGRNRVSRQPTTRLDPVRDHHLRGA